MHPVPLRAPGSLVAAAIATAVLLAACSGGSASPGSPDPSAGVVEVTASDYAFDPSTIALAPGTVTFRVENAGAEEHEFEIFEGDTVVDEIEDLVPGLTRELTVTLEAGQYTFVCKLADHEQRGMTGSLTAAP